MTRPRRTTCVLFLVAALTSFGTQPVCADPSSAAIVVPYAVANIALAIPLVLNVRATFRHEGRRGIGALGIIAGAAQAGLHASLWNNGDDARFLAIGMTTLAAGNVAFGIAAIVRRKPPAIVVAPAVTTTGKPCPGLTVSRWF